MILSRAFIALLFMPLGSEFLHAQNAGPENVETFLQTQMQKWHIPGLQYAVIRHGAIVKLGSFGLANIQDSIPVTNKTLFQTNSITKAFTGVAIMQLVEAGKLDIAGPISRYLDGMPSAWRPITIRQLLTHTSGIPDIWDNQGRLIADGEEAAWARVQTLPMDFAPGEQFRYNQTNYILLGKIIDKLSGEPFARFIKEQQFDVAGMPESGFYDSHDVVPHSAHIYRYVAGNRHLEKRLTCVFDDFPPFLRTAVGINTTAEEMARWIIALQQGKLLKKKSSIEALWTPGVLNDGSSKGFGGALSGYALGWPRTMPPEERVVGGIGAGRTAFFIYPDQDLAVVVLTNLQFGAPEALVFGVAGHYVRTLDPSTGFGLPPAIKTLRSELKRTGFEHAREVVEKLKSRDSKFVPQELDLNAWGYDLLREKQVREAIEIFKLAVDLYPRSANTYDSLAEAYENHGDRELAIKNYKKSLQLNPKNANAVEHLKGLEARS
jgi:CubicO group peptidase (beta-lactamase class C family)